MKIIVFALCLFPSFIFAQNSPNTITVTGHANCDVMPDEAIISVEFSSYNKPKKSAFEDNIRLFQKVLGKWEIAQEDVRLMDINALNYSYNVSKKVRLNKSFEIDLQNVSIIHELINDILTTGAYSVNIANLKYNELDSIQLEITKKAMINARKKASLMAESQGHSLGKTVSIREIGAESRESGNYYEPKYGDYSYDYRSRLNATGAVSRASPAYSQPELSLNSVYVGVSVKVVYEME
ncbi:MAG: hypothetical protein ACI9A7_000473 [Cyclobacteriaceae bacterium]|jgi:uncharacterized protein YggE